MQQCTTKHDATRPSTRRALVGGGTKSEEAPRTRLGKGNDGGADRSVCSAPCLGHAYPSCATDRDPNETKGTIGSAPVSSDRPETDLRTHPPRPAMIQKETDPKVCRIGTSRTRRCNADREPAEKERLSLPTVSRRVTRARETRIPGASDEALVRRQQHPSTKTTPNNS
mmetsp:Transcript_2739/g.6119  ORF Transcript_2739/g.6119 Transcript_2739/m.6119 type:complete len:169 (+) Transcript_2739:97-603(+)